MSDQVNIFAGGKGSIKKANKPKSKGMKNKRRTILRKIEEAKRKERRERRERREKRMYAEATKTTQTT